MSSVLPVADFLALHGADVDLIDAALDYALSGWKVFPCAVSKRPLVPDGFHAATTNDQRVRAWWRAWPDASIGAPVPDGLAVLDVDGPVGLATLRELARPHDGLPETLACRTGGGGWHLYYLHPGGELRQGAGVLGTGIDTRMPGRGYAILPPSGHPSGRRYAWHDETVEPVALPDWIVERLRPAPAPTPTPLPDDWLASDEGGHCAAYVAAAIESECVELAATPSGARNDRLNKAAHALARFVAAGEADAGRVVDVLEIAAGHAGLPAREIRRTIASAFRARGVPL